MKQKKIPLRSCVVTGEKLPKQELIRVIKTNEGKVMVDMTGKMNGHGAYIKKDLNVLNKAIKSKQLDRHLEIEISNDIYDELRQIISE